ncbi:MAG TPA: 30S ribosomal protein S4 [Thermoprotei archaeon]|nr:30S ribosomal protein S4 [Euryarchaeota archaeon]MCD6158996.1 30S ribosomal protein S4 [Euryarchaeota archaeon]HDJ51261.1 30S ribosomal protein S4 [Thermoprotei archaeon]
MGDPKRPRKKWQSPPHPWQKERLERETVLMSRYALKNKRELWKMEAIRRKYRKVARELLAAIAAGKENDPHVKRTMEAILNKAKRYKLIPEDGTLDDILAMDIERVLRRRLDWLVYEKGLAKTPRQARQLIVHGHIAIRGRRINVPSYLVPVDEEEHISYYEGSPLADEKHPLRLAILGLPEEMEAPKQEEGGQ